MRLLPLLALVSWAAAVPTARSAVKGIPETLYDRLVHFNAISQATYAGDLCFLPGLARVASILNTTTDIHGWVLRDDVAQELIVAFRGTLSETNLNTDENYTLANFDTLPSCSGCQVHGGYYLAWLSVIDQVQSLVNSQMTTLPTYSLIITGHSLGASLATLTAAQLSTAYPDLTVFTYGEPRSGNPAFASFLDTTFSTSSVDTTKFYRVTHENDGIVVAPPLTDGYVHQSLEFWSRDPPCAANTYICGGETLDCAAGLNGSGINLAHVTYFGRLSATCLPG
ncbi:alpha/beta-hydrolase [Coniochaeta ligniaria NRRL 30616]|uniref:Alpha/beta-hydrolase n=1 Tax=Coniochaeta ligniaria NRRL 30616 TaxID=1408157 RepID=A0A1J7JG68_9PEZI|nr:alpha/beta-hydrolase [Coniochaeta ligniaria NRRL 30616]